MSNPRAVLLALVPLSLACGPGSACLGYTDAFAACIEVANDNDVPNSFDDLSDPDGFCEEFAATADDSWDCLAETYENADCTTNEGLTAALAEAQNCGSIL